MKKIQFTVVLVLIAIAFNVVFSTYGASFSFFVPTSHAATATPSTDTTTKTSTTTTATPPTAQPATNNSSTTATNSNQASQTNTTSNTSTAVDKVDVTCTSSGVSAFFDCVARKIVYSIAWLFGIFAYAAALLFDWTVNPVTINILSTKSSIIYSVWKAVRDTLNLLFIFTLLFSAFATIFQAKEFHIKRVLLSVIIAALLVNFSYPISRFIIDVSHQAMFFILEQAFQNSSGGAVAAKVANVIGVDNILTGNSGSKVIDLATKEYVYLFALVIFMGLFAFTLIMFSVIFVIRLTALIILIMFSPVGFVCGILPSTKHYASDWWKNLFKWSFMAPITVFMMAISLKIMKEIATSSAGFSGVDAKYSVAGMDTMLGSIAFMAVPLVVLWMGLSVSMKTARESAGFIVDRAAKIAKWAPKFLGVQAGRTALGTAGGVGMGLARGIKTKSLQGVLSGFGSGFRYGRVAPDAVIKATKDTFGDLKKSQDSAIEDASLVIRRRMSSGDTERRVSARQQQIDVERTGEQVKLHNMENVSDDRLRAISDTNNAYTRAAALNQLAKNKARLSEKDINFMRNQFGPESQINEAFAKNVRKYDPTTYFNALYSDATQRAAAKEGFVNSREFDFKELSPAVLSDAEMQKAMAGKINASQLGDYANQSVSKREAMAKLATNDDFAKSLIESGIVTSAKQISDLVKSAGSDFGKNIGATFNRLAADFNAITVPAEMRDKFNKVYFAQNGTFHSSMNQSARDVVVRSLDANSAQALGGKFTSMNDLDRNFVASRIQGSQLVNIIAGMHDDTAEIDLLNRIRASSNDKAERVANTHMDLINRR